MFFDINLIDTYALIQVFIDEEPEGELHDPFGCYDEYCGEVYES